MYSPAGIEKFYEALSEPDEAGGPEVESFSYENLVDLEYAREMAREYGLSFFPRRASAAAA